MKLRSPDKYMVTEIRMPKYGWTMTEGKITKWLKKEGDPIREGEAIFEIETEKVQTEVEATASGILSKILEPEGSVVPVGQPIGIIAEPREEVPETSIIAGEIEVKSEPTDELPYTVEAKPQLETDSRISPLAKRLAKQYGIDPSTIKGAGPGGRITKDDIMKVVELQKKHLVVESRHGLREKIIPLTGTRKIIADRMTQSAKTTARVLYTIEVDMSEAVKLRQSLLEKFEEKARGHLSLTDIIVKAASKALEQHQIVNSIFLEDGIHMIEEINIGVAVALEDNLLVPVVHNANRKSLLEIAAHLDELIKRAKKNELTAKETTGGTFTVTNPGMLGIDIQMPVINTPESAILGIGNLSEKPTIANGQIVIRPMMRLNLVFDHRVFDGVPAAKFLQTLKTILEDPNALRQ
jgi:pyruvate dehydrogenase E2 component (dihydrolipoamide acetyltransferase)